MHVILNCRDALDTTVNFAAHHKFVLNWLKGQQKKKADPTSEKHATQADASEGDVKEPKSEDSQDKPSIEKAGEAEIAADAESPNSPLILCYDGLPKVHAPKSDRPFSATLIQAAKIDTARRQGRTGNAKTNLSYS